VSDDEQRSEPAETSQDAGDQLLASFVRIANRSGVELGITLWVRGTIVTGILVPMGKYLEEVAANFDPVEGAAPFADFFRRLKEHSDEQQSRADDDGLPVAHIHLRDSRTYAPGADRPIPTRSGVPWRGRLDSVDGFTFGTLSQE